MVLLIVILGMVGESVLKGLYGNVGGNFLDKVGPYECGFIDSNSPLNTYTIQFFIIGLSFMLFDLEILLIVPLILTYTELSSAFLCIAIFLLVASLAAYYELFGGVVDFF